MSALRCLRKLKKKRQDSEHKGGDETVMKPPDPKRAKIDRDKRIIEDLLDGIFHGLNTNSNSTPPSRTKSRDDVPSPPLLNNQACPNN